MLITKINHQMYIVITIHICCIVKTFCNMKSNASQAALTNRLFCNEGKKFCWLMDRMLLIYLRNFSLLKNNIGKFAGNVCILVLIKPAIFKNFVLM